MSRSRSGSRSRSRSHSSSGGYRSGSFDNIQPRSQSGQRTQSRQTRRNQLKQDGTASKDLRGGGNVTTTKRTSGDTSTRNTTVTTADGRSASGSRTTERSGDKIKTESNIRTSTGASRESKAEVKFDDGRIDKVKREVDTENRYGFETERKGEIERKEGYAEYKQEYKDSAGRDAKVEGDAWRGRDGQIYASGVADTKYWGEFGYSRTAGPQGRAAAAYGPYGGWLYTGAPRGGQRVSYYGRSYYSYGYAYYNPYYWGGILVLLSLVPSLRRLLLGATHRLRHHQPQQRYLLFTR